MAIADFIRTYGALYIVSLVCGLSMGSYAAAEPTTTSSPLTPLTLSFGAASCFALWACLDARIRRSTPCFDFGSFVFFSWLVAIPVYLMATRGWRGLLVSLSLFFTLFVSIFFAGFVIIFAQAMSGQ